MTPKMNTMMYSDTLCTCGATGAVHAGDCRFHAAPEIGGFNPPMSRRNLLRGATLAGMTAALPLLAAEAEADPFKPSVAQQKAAGDQAAKQILGQYPLVRDSRATHFSNVGAKLVNAMTPAERGPWDYRFFVIQSKDINAFAVPGGNMFMYTGLLDRITSDDELAAVTGHEMTHVRHEDWARAQAHNSKRQFGIAVLLGLTRAGAAARTIAGLADSVLSLHYSRGEEDSADAGGLANMVAAGYNPQGMIDLFKLLQAAANGRGSAPEFLSDHPDTAARIRRTQDRIRKLPSSLRNGYRAG